MKIEEIQSFIEKQTWTFAKTYAKKAPHGIFVLRDDELQNMTINDNERHFIKKLFKGSDIQHYETNKNSELNVLFIHRDDYISKDDHPNIYKHLNKFIDILKNRAEVEPNGSVLTYSINVINVIVGVYLSSDYTDNSKKGKLLQKRFPYRARRKQIFRILLLLAI